VLITGAERADHRGEAPEQRATVTRNDVEPNDATPADSDWTWAPYAPVPPAEDPRFCLDAWAPATTVRHPWVRVGRWTLLYRRAA
jgi:hypothetical protein